ncbi:MAG: hypothetical protein DHS20C21_23630 [Gemmatimonadota bacterium]|nr:MAG: hypothetical protein DHS20C21_23630 [Gemmatimonadota bacterium]
MDRSKVGAGIALLGLVFAVVPPAAAGTETAVTTQVRLRYEGSDRSFQPDVGATHGVYQRVRVRLDHKHESGVRGVAQLQDSRVWGMEGSTTTDTMNADLHQGYLSLDIAQVDGLTVSAGRKEWAYGRQRVIGSLGWSNVGRAFDGVQVHQKFGEHWLDLAFAKVSEDKTAASDENVALAVFHLSVPNSACNLEPFVIYREVQDAQTFTTSVGTYGNWQHGRFQVQEDFVFQRSEVRSSTFDGWLFAVDAAVDVSGAADGSLGGLVGYSTYTGNDPMDADDAAYSQLYPTGHAFHGSMDIAQPFADMLGSGLRDLHAKVWLKTAGGIKVVAAGHVFTSEVEATGVPGDGNDIGQELDVTITGRLAAGPVLEVGSGYFIAGDLMNSFPSPKSADDALWAYAQLTADF